MRPYLQRAAERHERAKHLLEEARADDAEEDPIEWYDEVSRSAKSGTTTAHRYRDFAPLDYDERRENGEST